MAEIQRQMGGVIVRGLDMDDETRCRHYHADVDIIAIRFACCNTYYPCHSCHEALADHPARPIPRTEWDQAGVLCGHCKTLLTVHEYLSCGARCPHCHASFNPGCALHYPLYFEGCEPPSSR